MTKLYKTTVTFYTKTDPNTWDADDLVTTLTSESHDGNCFAEVWQSGEEVPLSDVPEGVLSFFDLLREIEELEEEFRAAEQDIHLDFSARGKLVSTDEHSVPFTGKGNHR